MSKKGYYISYFLSEGFKGVFSNGLTSAGALSMLVCVLLVLGSFTLIVLNINGVINDIGDRNEIVVFIDESYNSTQSYAVGEQLLQIPHVSTATFISKEKALEEMKGQLGEYGGILEGMESDNPLRDSYRIAIDDLKQANTVIDALGKVAGVVKVRARNDIIEGFLNLRNVSTGVGLTLLVLLGVIAVFIISNNIRLSAFTRREEISIMRMVGATKTFIHFSFMVEGLFIGLIGSFVGFFVQWLFYDLALVPSVKNLNIINLVPFSTVSGFLLVIFVLIGILMGFAGSTIAIRKYLKV